MDMTKHNLFYFHRGKERGSYKMEAIIKKCGRYLLRKLIRKKIIIKKQEVVKLENEVIIFNCLWNGPWMTIQRIPKNPPYTSSNYLLLEFSGKWI